MIPDIRKGRFCKSACAEQIWPKTSICFPYAQCNSAFLLESQFIQHCYIVVVLHPPITCLSTLGLRVAGPSRSHLEGELGTGTEKTGKIFGGQQRLEKGKGLGWRRVQESRCQLSEARTFQVYTNVPLADQGILWMVYFFFR